MDTGFSVIMPTYNQASFIRRAILSLYKQTYQNWELIIINDGCTDETKMFIADYLMDAKVVYIQNETNMGLGYAINQGLNIAKYEYIAYLPSDDFYDEQHLEILKSKLDESSDVVLAFSGFRYDESENPGILAYRRSYGVRPEYSLQLIQVAHRRTNDRWIERMECVSEDLFFSFWRKLTDKGVFVPTLKITCEWTNHPNQRHKICGEKYGGGLNKYRQYYRVKKPIIMRTTNYKTINEVKIYSSFRERIFAQNDSMKILIVGELAYNPERIYAFEEMGHKLYGLWAKPRFCYSTVGPLPFGHIEDVPYDNWKEKVEKIAPDIIYAQLSTGAIEIAYEVLKANVGIPFVWHFKEGPHEAIKMGLWDKLIALYTYADGRIFLNQEIKDWFQLFLPVHLNEVSTYILDGDLPKANCFDDDFSKKISEIDGAIHTVITGRIIGLNQKDMCLLANNDIHVHVYNENHISEKMVMTKFRKVAPNHFHVHSHCTQFNWVKEFSKYDAGWLHSIDSCNENSLLRADWSDLNLPARINTLAAAGIPMIQKKNAAHISAMRNYVNKYSMGIFYNTLSELIPQLKNKEMMSFVEGNVRKHRLEFTFDYHVSSVVDFFKEVIRNFKND